MFTEFQHGINGLDKFLVPLFDCCKPLFHKLFSFQVWFTFFGSEILDAELERRKLALNAKECLQFHVAKHVTLYRVLIPIQISQKCKVLRLSHLGVLKHDWCETFMVQSDSIFADRD